MANPGETAADRSLPLGDVRVIAVEQAVAGPLCTRHLADLGADVIKVERPDGGDFAREYDSVARGQSAYFVWLNYGKRSVTLDLAADEDRARLATLLDGADVLVHNLGPGALGRLGFDESTLASRWPSLVRCAITGYGPDGPYRDRKAFDLLLQGESGLLDVTGTPGARAKVGVSIADIAAGLYATSAILAALRERDRSGAGTAIEVSMLDCLAEWMSVPTLYQRYAGSPPRRSGARHATIVPYGPYACADGDVNLAVQTQAQWERLCTLVLDRPALVGDPRFARNEDRVANRDDLEPIIDDALLPFRREDVTARLARADVPYGDINDVAGLVDHPQLAARSRWMDVRTAGGPVRVARPPFGLSGVAARAASVPTVGEHNGEIFG
jgi:crotonobetainyl-CoA:carnitine CoA-transferase CaiB-like acyl-CoA transferase